MKKNKNKKRPLWFILLLRPALLFVYYSPQGFFPVEPNDFLSASRLMGPRSFMFRLGRGAAPARAAARPLRLSRAGDGLFIPET